MPQKGFEHIAKCVATSHWLGQTIQFRKSRDISGVFIALFQVLFPDTIGFVLQQNYTDTFEKTGSSPDFVYRACGELEFLSLPAFFTSVCYAFVLSVSKIHISEPSLTNLHRKLME